MRNFELGQTEGLRNLFVGGNLQKNEKKNEKTVGT
jgi:hypothetical protein